MKRAQSWLGTMVQIELPDPVDPNSMQNERIQQAFSAAFSVIENVHKQMSVHEPTSLLSVLNQTAHHKPMRVSPLLYQVLMRAQRLATATQGLFDCNVAKGIVHGQQYLQLLPDGWVNYTQPIALDLGGIAKGYAVDLAVHTLRQYGIASGIVNAGGDLRVFGELILPINVRDPHAHNDLINLGDLANGACATSALYYQAQGQSHFFESHTNRSVITPHSYTVIAPTAVVADALTKVLALSEDPNHPVFAQFGAKAVIIKSTQQNEEQP